MKATLYPSSAPALTLNIKSFSDIQKLVGGYVAVAGCTKDGDILVNEEGITLKLPRNNHFPHLFGDVVVAPAEWENIPYSK